MLRIKELRKEKGISQEELAKKIQVKNYSIGDWERDRTEPNINTLIELANYFEVSVDYLIGRTEDDGIININTNLQNDEIQLLKEYKKLNSDEKNQVIGFAKALAYKKGE